jgi:hypothetical protein
MQDSNRFLMAQVRNVMWATLVPYQKKGAQFTPQKVMTFEWEKENLPELGGDETEAELLANAAAAAERWAERDAKREAKKLKQ